jgi:SAM-dependent methyltransferase
MIHVYFKEHAIRFGRIILKIPYSKKILLKIGFDKVISTVINSGIIHYDHYKDRYWNNLHLVQQYINQNATDNKETIWQIDILTRFKNYLPFKNVLVIGCGNGWVERQLSDLGIGIRFDAFDISEKYLEQAKNQRGDRKIRYFKADLNKLDEFPLSYYDAIFNVGVLHHGFRLSRIMWFLSRSLKPSGLMFNFDYVGPAQNNYSDNHLKIMEEINKSIPKRFQSPHRLRPVKEDFVFGDPTEAIHADLVRSTFERFFDNLYQRDLNGGIGYQILVNNIEEFEKNDDEALETLQYILEQDAIYTKSKQVPVMFWYSVGTPKSKCNIKNWELLPT